MKVSIWNDKGFKLIEEYRFNDKYTSYVFLSDGDCFIIDYGFDAESDSKCCFDYSKYCEMQNSYMLKYKRVFRYNIEESDEDTIDYILKFLFSDASSKLTDDGGSFSDSHIDNTVPEAFFEDVFVEAYGYEALECLRKEVAISNDAGKNYFIDYTLETTVGNFAFEENGVNYHHPCIVGKKRYNELLHKQNTIMMLGYKVYRFSTGNLQFRDKIIQDLKMFLPSRDNFIPKMIFKNERGLELYSHQSSILKDLDRDRLNNKNTALIVIPTAAGKSEICITDLSKDYIVISVKRILIMVPSVKVKEDWLERIKVIEDKYETIDVLFYNTAFINKANLPQDYYDYIIFDEAHHAQAANCKATIQYFRPKYLIGLTATDERLDQKKLEDVFGKYNVKLTLKEAIENRIVSNIRAYRLESNINLKEVRFNGKDYNSSDLERSLIIDSRNELIADTLVKYFMPKDGFYKQGIIFCVNKAHTKKLEALLNTRGIKAAAVYGGNSKNNQAFSDYENKKIQFLCSCQIISEGWDSPQTEVVVMARPTLSKVLYMQQVGRGLRRYPNKECLYLIDVVDNYSAKLVPWSFNSLFHLSTYTPFIGVIDNNIDYLTILGLSEHELAMKEIDIFSFEEKYKDYLSLEQAARELYIGTQTLNGWNKTKSYASLYLPIGNKVMPYFSKDDIERIRLDKKLSIHTDDTILTDFLDFIDENTLTFSFKLIFLINALKLADNEGNVNLTDLTKRYSLFYLDRINRGLAVDKKNCIYNVDNLNNDAFVKKSILDNPFEKFERKRFFFHSKDLNIISFNFALWSKLDKSIINDIINKEKVFLKAYYENYGGYDYEYEF